MQQPSTSLSALLAASIEPQVKETLEMLRLMANDTLENFKNDIRLNEHTEPHTVRRSKILNTQEYITCVTSDDISGLAKTVREVVSGFATGPMADGLVNNAVGAISARLDNGGRQIWTEYGITINPLGGISRLDSMYFTYTFYSDGLKKTVRSVVASCVIRSSANVKDLDDNTLRVLVDQCFGFSDLELRKAIYAEVYETLFHHREPRHLESLRLAKESQQKALAEWGAPRQLMAGVRDARGIDGDTTLFMSADEAAALAEKAKALTLSP